MHHIGEALLHPSQGSRKRRNKETHSPPPTHTHTHTHTPTYTRQIQTKNNEKAKTGTCLQELCVWGVHRFTRIIGCTKLQQLLSWHHSPPQKNQERQRGAKHRRWNPDIEPSHGHNTRCTQIHIRHKPFPACASTSIAFLCARSPPLDSIRRHKTCRPLL